MHACMHAHPQVLAWLVLRRGMALRKAMEVLQRARPEAAPNAGYLAALAALEEGLTGRQTVKVSSTPSPSPPPGCLRARVCTPSPPPVCIYFPHPPHPFTHPSHPPMQVRRTKPEPRLCPECGEKVGLSEQSVRVHLRLKHADLRWVVHEWGRVGGAGWVVKWVVGAARAGSGCAPQVQQAAC